MTNRFLLVTSLITSASGCTPISVTEGTNSTAIGDISGTEDDFTTTKLPNTDSTSGSSEVGSSATFFELSSTSGPAHDTSADETTTIESDNSPQETSTSSESTGLSAICSNMIIEGSEECDDGNNDNSDDCTTECKLATCGDGYIHMYVEPCDDGSQNGEQSRCSQNCTKNWLYAFISSEKYTANLGGITGADEKCQMLANSFHKNDANRYLAWISQSDNQSTPMFGPGLDFHTCNLPIRTTTDQVIAPSLQALYTSEPEHYITFDEKKDPQTEKFVWTQTQATGNPFPPILDNYVQDCGDWSFDFVIPQIPELTAAVVGWATNVIPNSEEDEHDKWDHWNDWTEHSVRVCTDKAHIYCFEQCD